MTIFGIYFSLFDLATLLLVLFSLGLSIKNGFAHSLLATVAWILAVGTTFWLYPFVRPIVLKVFSSTSIVIYTTLGLSFFVSALVFLSIASFLSKQVQNSKGAIRTYDKLFGFLFGVIRGFVLASLIVLVFLMRDSIPLVISKSFVYPLTQKTAQWMELMSPQVTQSIQQDLTNRFNDNVVGHLSNSQKNVQKQLGQ